MKNELIYSRELGKLSTFFADIPSLPIALLGGTADAAYGLNVLAGESFLVIEDQKRGRSSGLRNIFRSYHEFQRRINAVIVLVILRILQLQNIINITTHNSYIRLAP